MTGAQASLLAMSVGFRREKAWRCSKLELSTRLFRAEATLIASRDACAPVIILQSKRHNLSFCLKPVMWFWILDFGFFVCDLRFYLLKLTQ